MRPGVLGLVVGLGLCCLSQSAPHSALANSGAPRGNVAPTRADSDGVVVTLHEPIDGQVLIAGGMVQLGSAVPEITQAQRMCREELRRDACDSSLFSDEMLAHDVVLSGYWLDRTEVTNEAYGRCVEAGACVPPAYPGARRWTAVPTQPATLVTWYDADRYCRWRGGRLPTEAEWERAARGMHRRTYPWGDVYAPLLSNHGRAALHEQDRLDDGDGFAELAPVGSFPAARTTEGVYDLAGNVEEWVADWYSESYADVDLRNPKGPSNGDFRVLRGGSFRDGRAWLRSARRHHELPSVAHPWVGFRCAKSAP